MMDRKKIEDLVLRTTRDYLATSIEETKLSSSFLDDLGADSLDVVELIMAFEEEFAIEIPDDDAEKINTLKDAVDYIEKKAT